MSRQIITIIVVILLLAAIAVVNYMRQMDPTQLAARGVGKGGHHHHDDESKPEEEPPPMSRSEEDYVAPIGPEGAPVKIQVVYSRIEQVQSEMRPLMEQVAGRYAPHVRIEFLDATKAENRPIIDAVANNLDYGLIINGAVTKEVPTAAFGMVTFSGSPQFEQWSMPELFAAIERDLQKQGVQFESHLDEQPAAPAHEHEHEGHSH